MIFANNNEKRKNQSRSQKVDPFHHLKHIPYHFISSKSPLLHKHQESHRFCPVWLHERQASVTLLLSLFIHVSISYPSTSVWTTPISCTSTPSILPSCLFPSKRTKKKRKEKSSGLSRKTHWISPPWIESAKAHFCYGDAIKESVGIGVE